MEYANTPEKFSRNARSNQPERAVVQCRRCKKPLDEYSRTTGHFRCSTCRESLSY